MFMHTNNAQINIGLHKEVENVPVIKTRDAVIISCEMIQRADYKLNKNNKFSIWDAISFI